MNIYLFAAGNPDYAEKLLDRLDKLIIREQLILLPADFLTRGSLDFEMHSGEVMILIPGDEKQLEQLIKLKELLEDFRLILVLPDSNEENITNGHLLMPRYLTFITSDLDETIRVLERMTAPQINESQNAESPHH